MAQLNATQFLQQYGITKSLFVHLLSAKKFIPLEYQDLLQYYKLHYWKGSYILEQTSQKEGRIEREGKQFIVVFKVPRGLILQFPELQYQVSFREAIPEAGIPGYVLIS